MLQRQKEFILECASPDTKHTLQTPGAWTFDASSCLPHPRRAAEAHWNWQVPFEMLLVPQSWLVYPPDKA